MSEERLLNLANEYPEYSGVFQAVLGWFDSHPNANAISMDQFYSNKFNFSREQLKIAFMIMKEKSIIVRFYRLFDDDGSKIGKDYFSKDEIPIRVDTLLGELKDTKDISIVPYYSLKK